MLAIQAALRNGSTPESLKAELGINHYRHPSLPLVGFKYSQIDSPKTHPVVRDARGIVLEDGSWDVVAKPFRRFFNAGEDAENFAKFNWADFTATTKEDGSLILVSNYAGEWHVNTSGSFGLGECGFSCCTWRQVFWETSGIDRAQLVPGYTYIFELCSIFNKVVRTYPRPAAYLLSMFYNETLEEASVELVDEIAIELDVPRPDHHHFTSMDDITAFLSDKEGHDKTFEGIVVRDSANERYKIKSQTYLALHHLLENGNIFNPKRLVPLVLAGETAEVVAYLPEVAPYLEKVQDRLDGEFSELEGLWESSKAIETQRDFAKAIVGRTKFSGLLFNMRKAYGGADVAGSLSGMWRDSGDLIVKALYS